MDHLDAAVADFQRAQQGDANQSVAWDGLAIVRQRQGDDEETERLLREATRRDPAAVRPRIHLADLLLMRGAREDALGELAAALAVNPAYPPALERAAEVESARGHLPQARD